MDIQTDSSELSAAIEVFVRGFSEAKSRTWPYEVIRKPRVWVMRDVARPAGKDYRKEEWVTLGCEPKSLHALALQDTRGRYFICPIVPDEIERLSLLQQWKQLGYRLIATEPLFVHNLKRIPRTTGPAQIRLVRSDADAAALAQAKRIRPVPRETWSRDEYRQYLARVDGRLVGWARSIETPHGTWCADLSVLPEFRRQGIGSQLMETILRHDRKRGSPQAVLLASKTGAHLYPLLGYRQIALLMILSPPRRAKETRK